MNVTETVSLIEIIWTGPAMLGLLFTSWMVVDIWRDRRVLRRSGWNGLARLQADRWLRSESIVVLIHAIFTGVGLFAMTQPSSAPADRPPSLFSIVLTSFFIAVPALLVIRSIGDRVVRRAVRRQAWGDRR